MFHNVMSHGLSQVKGIFNALTDTQDTDTQDTDTQDPDTHNQPCSVQLQSCLTQHPSVHQQIRAH